MQKIRCINAVFASITLTFLVDYTADTLPHSQFFSTFQAGDALMQPDIAEFFVKAIQQCVPKSHAQAMGEVRVTAAFLNNFGGDNVRRLAQVRTCSKMD